MLKKEIKAGDGGELGRVGLWWPWKSSFEEMTLS